MRWLSRILKRSWASENYGERRHGDKTGGIAPDMVIIHYTGMRSADDALERLCNADSGVSAHYLIDEKGRDYNLVPEDKRAWHAGDSSWQGESDINSRSIGIELVNPGYDLGYRPFSRRQIDALIDLLGNLDKRYEIPAGSYLGHSDIAPGRKKDPGHLFPWERLAKHGFGLWPKPEEMDYQTAEDILPDRKRGEELLRSFGYTYDAPFDVLIREFHRHFYPAKFKPSEKDNEPDILSFAKLLSLIRQSGEDNH